MKPLKLLKSLSQKKYRDEHGVFLAEGPDVVAQLLASEYTVLELLIAEQTDDKYGRLAALASKRGAILRHVPEKTMRDLAGTVTTQGILAVAKTRIATQCAPGLSVYLDAVQDPGNVGAVIRTAAATGFANVIAGPGTADFFNPKTVRASAGGISGVQLVLDPGHTVLSAMKGMGYCIAATSCTQGKSPASFKTYPRLVIIMGNEGQGVSGPVQNMADSFIHIPMRKTIASLNIAVAFGVIAFSIASE